MTNELHAPASWRAALKLANASTTMRRSAVERRQPLPTTRHAQWALPNAWRNEYWPSHTSGVGTQPESQLETRLVFCGGDLRPQKGSSGHPIAAPARGRGCVGPRGNRRIGAA